jgi:eukaryotic-like serine/threonine-protein kinase
MDGASSNGDDCLAIGTVVNDSYRVTGRLGAGAMGTVYRAEDVQRNTPVALKVLHGFLATEKEASARFRREAFVGVKLVHQNCVPVIDFGTMPDGSFFLAMELVPGESLGEVLDREGRLPWQRALHITRHVLRGLDHAHRESIVHRDIKPDNIAISNHEGDPDFARVLDFGIAKLVDANSQAITRAGMSVGTPSYLSPEQATGGVIDARCDIYSVSIVLYEMLTGRTPFGDVEPRRRLYAHAAAPVPVFSAVAPGVDIPAEVEELVRAGLAKAPDDRIASAAAYLARIDALLAPAETPAPQAVAHEPTAPLTSKTALPRRRRRRGLVGLVIAAAIVAATVAVIRPWQRKAPSAASSTAAMPSPPEPAPPPPAVKAAINALEHGKTCKARRNAVIKLRALQHPSAIPHLEKARAKSSNACLKTLADATLADLQQPAGAQAGS